MFLLHVHSLLAVLAKTENEEEIKHERELEAKNVFDIALKHT